VRSDAGASPRWSLPRPTPWAGRLIRLAALPVGMVVSALIVAQASYSAFSATTVNPTNNWAAGTVALSDDDSATAMFTVTGLRPGSTGTRCIAVTSTGTVPSAVRLYTSAASFSQTNGLADAMTLTVTQGTGGSFGSCTGYSPLGVGGSLYSGSLTGFSTTATSYATGLGTWAPTGAASETRVFQFTYTLPTTAPNGTQAGTAAIGFTWEAQST